VMTNEKVDLFKQLVSEISIRRYTQEEFAGIVEAIHKEVFKVDAVTWMGRGP
jgi:stress response protein YsnF